MTLLEAFEQNLISDEKYEKQIETIFSKLFLFSDKVIKIYKYSDNYYGQFSDVNFRKEFYSEDFSWNNTMAPDIYLSLNPYKLTDGQWTPTSQDQAEDFYVEMKRIDDKSNVTQLLLENKITDQNLRDIGTFTSEKLKELTVQKKTELSEMFLRGGKKLIGDNLQAIEKICQAFSPKTIEKDYIENAIKKLIAYFNNSNYFQTFDDNRLEASIDNHSDNVLVIDNKVGFIDILLPQKDMRVTDSIFNMAKISCCVAALAGKEKADLIYESYIKEGGHYEENIRNFYEVFGCFLLSIYNDGLGRGHLSKAFFKYVEDNITKLV